MKEYLVTCPHCGVIQSEKRKNYSEFYAEILEWVREEPESIAAKDALDNIDEYKKDHQGYEDYFYEATPVFCCDCKESYYYNHKTNEYDYIPILPRSIIAEGFRRMKNVTPSKGYIYFLQDIKTGLVKIGCTRNVERRMKSIKALNYIETRRISVFEAGDENTMFSYERALHKKYDKYHEHHEWFSLPENLVQALLAEGREYHEIKRTLESLTVPQEVQS